MNGYFEERFEGTSKARLKLSRHHLDRKHSYYTVETDFKCIHCSVHVTTDPYLAGVKNRNHCPYCLRSRHLDWFEAGDRLSPCKARMEPVGLTLKRTGKKYNTLGRGELMLIHQCVDCGKLSINRIAADDDSQTILALLDCSPERDPRVRVVLKAQGIQPLGSADRTIVLRQLFGA